MNKFLFLSFSLPFASENTLVVDICLIKIYNTRGEKKTTEGKEQENKEKILKTTLI